MATGRRVYSPPLVKSRPNGAPPTEAFTPSAGRDPRFAELDAEIDRQNARERRRAVEPERWNQSNGNGAAASRRPWLLCQRIRKFGSDPQESSRGSRAPRPALL